MGRRTGPTENRRVALAAGKLGVRRQVEGLGHAARGCPICSIGPCADLVQRDARTFTGVSQGIVRCRCWVLSYSPCNKSRLAKFLEPVPSAGRSYTVGGWRASMAWCVEGLYSCS